MSVVEETKLASTPLPLPVHFSQAEQSFSLKKRRLPFSSFSNSSLSHSPSRPSSHSLPPRPVSKGCPPLSRVFPQRRSPWKPLSRGLISSPLPISIYDPCKQETYFSQCFINLGLIGKGSFGEVFKVRSLLDNRVYAVKCSAQRFRGNLERAQCVQEALNHERLHPHPHILGFCAAWEEAERLYIQTELCCTSLLQYVESQSTAPGEGCAWNYLCDLLSALNHLHSHGFAHLDIKPANIFLTHSGRLKLGDFGLLLELDSDSTGKGTGEKKEAQEGDPRYLAPELLRGEYGTAADVFSLGVSILELACNVEVPKRGEDWQQLRRGILPSEFVNALTPELQHVLELMLIPEPKCRATVEQLLSLPSVCKRRWRRTLQLHLRESWLSVLGFGQSVLSTFLHILWSLNITWVPRSSPLAPSTPPRDQWEAETEISILQHSSVMSDSDDPALLPEPLGLEHSPTFRHRIQMELSKGSTSTPLPAPCLSPSNTSSHTHSPAHMNTCSPRLSPIHLGSPKPRERGCEPRNLLSLFDEASLESES